MERELWPILYKYIHEVAKEVRQKYVQMQPWIIVTTMLWAAVHDRPVCWACNPEHWDTTPLRPLRIPSEATMSRRVDAVATGIFWHALEKRLRDSGDASLVAFIDGKPLTIGGNSKDPDAHWGRGVGGMAMGYKLHTVWSTRVLPEAWEVTALNISEKAVARRLIDQLHGGGYLLADGEYDASDLYDQAFARGYRMVAPYRKAKNPGSGKHYQSPHRLQNIETMQHAFGKELYKMRTQIERCFGNATNFGGGLAPLPAWVRGLARVRTWVWAKLLINAARILRNKDLDHP